MIKIQSTNDAELYMVYELILNDGMCTKNASLGNKGILEWKIQFIILPVPYSFGAF